MRTKSPKKAPKRNMQKLHSGGDFWQPEKIGEKFCGRIIGRHVGETKYGEKPFIEIANDENGEVIVLISGNIRLRALNRLPVGAYVELEYMGQEKALIGGKYKKIANIVGTYDASESKLGEDWTGGKYYGKEGKKPVRGGRRKSKKVKK